MPDPNQPSSTSGGVSSPLQFRFRIRTDPIDWHRLSAMDIDHVVQETDINLLQEFISAVTFCKVEGARCFQCHCPIDITLLKTLRLAQLCTEYLLFCQEYLRKQVLRLEESMEQALSQVTHEKEEQARLQKELNEVKVESHRRKKLLFTQQKLLQASVNNYHKCQYCEKCFINHSYLQSHIQRRHPEINDTESQKMKQVEKMKATIAELKEKLRLTQNYLQAGREAETHRIKQEDQRRRELAEKEMEEEKWQEERQKVQEEITELKQVFFQELKYKANKSFLGTKLHELEGKVLSASNLAGDDDHEKEQMRIREQALKEQKALKKNLFKKKPKEMGNRLELEKEELQSENARLMKVVAMENSSSSNVESLKQQVHFLCSQLKQKNTLINSQKKKIKELCARSQSEPLANTTAQTSSHEAKEEDDDDEEECLVAQHKLVESMRRNTDLLKSYRPIVDEHLQEKLEELGLRKGTKGISNKSLKHLSALLYTLRVQRFRLQTHVRGLRENSETELNNRLKELQMKLERAAPSKHTQKRTKVQSSTVVLSTKHKQISSELFSKDPKSLQPPTPALRFKVASHTVQKQSKHSTPPFSSEEKEEEHNELGENSPWRLPLVEQQRVEFDWSGSDGSNASNFTKMQQAHSEPDEEEKGSVVQTLRRTLAMEVSSSVTSPAKGIGVLSPASQHTFRPTIIKQQVCEVESDVDVSSTEELIAPSPARNVSSDVFVTCSTSVWSSAADGPEEQ